VAVRTFEAKCVTEAGERVEARRPTQTSLEVRNAANTHASAFGERFLRQRRDDSITFEKCGE
jgi:hypothetical protein